MNRQITVLVDHCTIQINLDPFFNRTTQLARQKKLLGYVFREPWRNEEAIGTMDTYLPQKRAEAKAAWEVASKRYQDEYISTQFRYDLTAQQRRTMEVANRKMLNEVKWCKTNFEHWVKLIAYYEALRANSDF